MFYSIILIVPNRMLVSKPNANNPLCSSRACLQVVCTGVSLLLNHFQMKRNKLVIIDDHPDVLELLTYWLSREGYDVKVFTTAVDALKFINHDNTDLVITDWVLPEMDGLEFCKKLKQNSATVYIPVVMATGKSDEIDVVTALEVGAEDYFIKPFRSKEMLTRIKKILKRAVSENFEGSGRESVEAIIRGKFKIYSTDYKAFLDEKPLDLTISEYKLLELFVKRPGKVFSRNQIIERINGIDYFATERSIDVHIVSLRKKLGQYKSVIETVRSVGYRFNEAVCSA